MRKYLLFRSMARKRAQVLPDMWVRSLVPTYHGGGELMLTVVTRECFVGFMGDCELATRGRRWLMINPSPARLARISRDLPDGWATSVRTLHGPDPATGSAPSIKGDRDSVAEIVRSLASRATRSALRKSTGLEIVIASFSLPGFYGSKFGKK